MCELALIWLCNKFVVVFDVMLSRSPDFCNCSICHTWQLSVHVQAKPVIVTLLGVIISEFFVEEWNNGRNWWHRGASGATTSSGKMHILNTKLFTALEKLSSTESNKNEIQ
jgi:hypothetical protein